MTVIGIYGGPAPYREAICLRLETKGHVVIERRLAQVTTQPGHNGSADVDASVVFCNDDVAWDGVAALAEAGPVVAVIAELNIESYARALTCGAGAVYFDNSTEIICDVIEAACNGEALLPLGVGQQLAAAWQPSQAIVELTPTESRLGEALKDGTTVATIARELAYSDRTVRRKLQGLYLKLGVNNRTEAVQLLSRA